MMRSSLVRSGYARGLTLSAYVLASVGAVLGTMSLYQRGGDPYRVGDWLINYSGGFVRRGLMGQLLLWVGQLLPGGLLATILAIQLGLYSSLLWLGFKLFESHLPRRCLLLFLALSPATFLFESLNAQSFRKELLGLVFLAVFCRMLQSRPRADDNNREQRWLWFAALVYPLLIFTHEISLLLLPFVFLALTLKGYEIASFKKPSLFLLFGSTIAFLAVALRPGDELTAKQILDSWHGLVPEASLAKESGDGAILSLRHSTSSAILDVQKRFVEKGYLYPLRYGVVTMLTGFGFIVNYEYLKPLWSTWFNRLLILSSTLMLGTLFVVAKDWGRLIYISSTALTLVLLVQPPLERRLSNWAHVGVAVLAVIYSLTWRVPISKESMFNGASKQVLR